MANQLNIDEQVVARRCTVKSPDYNQLTSLDWVVLDFTDGLRSFESLLSLIPTTKSDLAASFIHLRLLGLLTWTHPEQSHNSRLQDCANPPNPTSRSNPSNSQLPDTSACYNELSASSLRSDTRAAVSLPPTTGTFSIEVCAQYLPPRLMTTFGLFRPRLIDKSLDLSVEMQYFTQFLHENLATLSPYDLLGLTEGQCTKNDVKQAYLLRTKQFHPDRYFRQNIGPFAPRISAVFKAVTGAYTALQAKLKS